MSFWYDKKGKSYASKGNSSWIKSYAEHLIKTLKDAFDNRFAKHMAGADDQHKAEHIIYDDTSSVKDVIQSNHHLANAQVSSLEAQFRTTEKQLTAQLEAKASALETQLQEGDAALDARLQEKTSALETQLQEETSALRTQLQEKASTLETQLQEETSALETQLQEEISLRETGLAQKVDKEEGKGLSSCDFTQAEKRKLSEFSSIGSFEKTFSAEDWVDGVLHIPYEEHQNSNPAVSVFCNRYDYEEYQSEKICATSGCGNQVTAIPVHPETEEEGSFHHWFVPSPKTVKSRLCCEDCVNSIQYDQDPHPYFVRQVAIGCSVVADDAHNINLQSDIAFDGKVVIK